MGQYPVKPVKEGRSGIFNTKKGLHRGFDFYVLLFFLLSFTGWLWEVALCLIQEQTFVNRGIYTGPYLPIYGVGGIVLYLLLGRRRRKPLLVFILSAAICSVIEYFGSWFLEFLWEVRWWDYSGHLLNINGRICLAGSAAFGIGGMLLLCVLLPRFERWYHKMGTRKRTVLCLLLVSVFIIDAAETAGSPNMGEGVSFPAWRPSAEASVRSLRMHF